ncbi:MAG: thiamine phosphate synthase [Heliobacteriaceae bacterium]|nr:thiamine phosphate synthase [Heliobacteriaceae bacterium]
MTRLQVKALFRGKGLYGITAEAYSRGRRNPEVVRQLIAAGVKIIQYREKEKSKREKYRECLQLREITRRAGVALVVNDDLDLALLVGADGLHLGQEDLPVAQARELGGPDLIIGVSTHSPVQARAAVAAGADYIGVGPLFATKTKKDVCAPVGLEYLDYVVANIALPFVAIGGIKEHNLAGVVNRGACWVAMVTDIVGAVDIPEKISRVRRILVAE